MLSVVPLANESNQRSIMFRPTYTVHSSPSSAMESRQEYKILVSIHLKDDIKEYEASHWAQWLGTEHFDGTLSIDLHGVFRSKSTLIIVAFPPGVWGFLPQNPAYQTIGEVLTEGSKLSVQPQSSNGHLLRTRSGPNTPPVVYADEVMESLKRSLDDLRSSHELSGSRTPILVQSVSFLRSEKPETIQAFDKFATLLRQNAVRRRVIASNISP